MEVVNITLKGEQQTKGIEVVKFEVSVFKVQNICKIDTVIKFYSVKIICYILWNLEINFLSKELEIRNNSFRYQNMKRQIYCIPHFHNP